jgi:hypothetical protein
MTDLFETKIEMPGNANVRMAESYGDRSDAPVRTAQTLRELYDTRRADASQSVVNIKRPRYGHAY